MLASSENNSSSSASDENTNIVTSSSNSTEQQQQEGNNTNFEQVGWNQTKIDRPTEEDIQVIEKVQLKKAITVPNAIVKRCKWGYPQVTFAFTSKNKAETSENTYVPGTFLWLTCPRVNLIIDKVETSDEFNEIRREFGAELNFSKTKLKNQNKRKSESDNPSEKKQKQESEASVEIHQSQKNNLLMESFENYDKWLLEEAKITEGQDKGQALLTPEEFTMWKYSVYEKNLNNLPPQRKRYGNAGVSYPSSIKCLHSHISSYFAGSKDHVGKRAFEAGQRVITEVLNETDIEDLANPLDCRSNCIKSNAYFTIVAKDCPIYELEISTSKKTDQSQLKQFVLHASLDAVEELQWTTNALFLKSIDRFNEFNIYGFVTGGNIRFLLLFENDKKNDDQTIKSFFSDVFELYIKIQMNPFYELYSPINSHDFDNRVKQLANKYIS